MDIEAVSGQITKLSERLQRGPISDLAFLESFRSLLTATFALGVGIDALVSDVSDAALAKYAIDTPTGVGPVDNRNLSERAAKLALQHWRTSSCGLHAGVIDELVRRLGELVLTHWGTRDQGTLLPRLLDAGMPERVLQSVQDMVSQGGFLAVVHADMDKFKAINDEFGESAGNLVIRAFADRLRDAFADLGVVVRTGGEEFSAFLVSDDPLVFFVRAEAFRTRMQSEPLPVIDRSNTCSMGLAVYPIADLPADLQSTDRILRDVRLAEKRAKTEGRNRIRLPKPLATDDVMEAAVWTDPLEDIKRSALACRVALGRSHSPVFRTIFAGAVARLLTERLSAEDVGLMSLAEIVGEFASRLDVITEAAPWRNFGRPSPPVQDRWPEAEAPSMPTAVWAAIVARALLSATYRSGGPLYASDELSFRVATTEAAAGATSSELFLDIHRPGTADVFLLLGPVALDATGLAPIHIGRPWFPASAEGDGLRRVPIGGGDQASVDNDEAYSPCLLMPIGDAAIQEAKAIGDLVASVVEIDDRPVKGGGLPDFWQSNLGRIVRICLRNPNISHIIAVGEEDGAGQTIARLKLSKDGWNGKLPDLQRRLSIGADHLAAFRSRGIEFKLVPSGGSCLLDAVVACTGSPDLPDPRAVSAVDLDREMARRRLAVPSPSAENQLSIDDGLRCRSLADAYPQAIQLLRGSNEAPQTETTRRTFREFPCFKLVLTQPFQDDVPDYWLREKASITDYYEKHFSSPQGLFGKRLVTFGDHEQTVRDHGVASAVAAIRERRPTRRIMLPVATSDELDAPLGLSMIQVLPRERDGKWHLDFQWIWRTVEVLVGFPFSANGSIRWSDEFFKSVQERLEAVGDVDRLERGQLTYVALSFHMFLDVGDKEIARAIVQDATR